MSTQLIAITNSKFSVEENRNYIKNVSQKLNLLHLNEVNYINSEGANIKETGTWEYHIVSDPFRVEFNGPYEFFPTLYSNIGIIDTIHSYSTLYSKSNQNWYNTFRKNLYDVVNSIGGTEVIFLADNGCNMLSEYLEDMAIENIAYEEIKARMINELGNPITDHAILDTRKLDYKNITEFFLDEFKDLKT